VPVGQPVLHFRRDIMKPAWALCLVLLFLVAAVNGQQPTPPKPLTPEQQEQLKERDRFEKDAQTCRQAGKFSEAVVAAEKMLAIERAVFGDFHQDVAGSFEILAELHESLEDFSAARQSREKVLTIKMKLLGTEHWQV